MQVEFESRSNDFEDPSLKIIAESYQDAYALGQISACMKAARTGWVEHTDNKQVWIRVRLHPAKEATK